MVVMAGSSSAPVTLKVNGELISTTVEVRKLLADFIREDLGLTGTKLGCEQGVCGACTVLLGGRPVRSCLMFAVQAEGEQLETIEGQAPRDATSEGDLSPVQSAMWRRHGLQCGFCTPGMVMTITALMRREESYTLDEIKEHLSGNLCRCTGYAQILRAAMDVLKHEPGDAK